jgi:hypothetical protein
LVSNGNDVRALAIDRQVTYRTHQRELRVAEHHRQRGAAWPHAQVGPAPGVVPGDAALIGGFVQQRPVFPGITGDEHGAVARLAGPAVVDRNTGGIARETAELQAHVVDVGAAAGGREQQLAGHAVHACAGGAVLRALDQQHVPCAPLAAAPGVCSARTKVSRAAPVITSAVDGGGGARTQPLAQMAVGAARRVQQGGAEQEGLAG